jgi:hypothetical protein
MKLIGMLIVLGGILYLTYTLAGDQLALDSNEGEVQMEPLKAANDVMDKVNSAKRAMADKIDNLK